MSKIRYKEFYETEGSNRLDKSLNDWLDANPDVVIKDMKFSFNSGYGSYLPMAIALVAYEVVKKEEEVDPNSSAMQYPFD